MSGLKQVGWLSAAGMLFPLSYYKPDLNSAHDAHKADWEPVFVVAEEVRPLPILTPAMRADAAAIGACCDPMSLDSGEPA